VILIGFTGRSAAPVMNVINASPSMANVPSAASVAVLI
jgi:hypothetical protein